VVTEAEKLAALSKKVDDLTAKHIALEALFEHMTAPIFLAVVPQLALKIVAAAREMDVKLPDGPAKLRIEEQINSLVDRLEHRLRSKAGSKSE
jgi:hypothetical protein